jgi:hypothetical protein
LRDLQPCITYTIAPNGSWEMFPIEAAVPSSFTVLWQTLVAGSTNSAIVPNSVVLQAGKEYVAVVGVGNASGQRSAFGSKRFTP